MKQRCSQIIAWDHLLAGFLVWMSLLVVGCASQQSSSSSPSTSTATFKPLTKQPDTSALLGPMVESIPFAVTDGKFKGKQWTYSHRKGASDKEHLMIFVDQHRSVLNVNDDGRVLLSTEDDYGQQVKVVYDPPLEVIPADMLNHEPKAITSSMTVYNLDGQSQRDKGACQVSVQILGKQTITTPAGTFEAIMFKTTRQLKLALASGTVTIYDAYAPKKGLVSHRVEQKLITMGFIPLNSVLEVQRSQ
jgi:hypothetical protein